MKSSIKPIWFLAFTFLFCVSSFPFVSLTSRVNKSEIKFDENFTYTLRFEGLKSPIQQPSLPEIDGGTVKGQYQTVEPLKEGFAYLYHYIISPTRTGLAKMGDFSIKVENQTLKATGFEVKIVEGSKPVPQPPQIEKTSGQMEIFLEGRVSKNECYESEAIVYTLHLLTRESVRNFEFVNKPDFDGFRKIELPSSRYPKTSKIEKNGKLFLDAVVFKAVLFPLKSGFIQISQFVSDAKIQTTQGVSQIVRLKGGDAKVSILPLPTPPKGFKGCVGNFVARISPQKTITAKVKEIFSVEVEIEGEGALPSEPFDIPQSPFFEPYPMKVSDSSEELDGKFISKKKVVLSYTPLVEGNRTLPDISFIFFDTKKKVYETITLKIPQINVLAGATEIGEKKISILPPIPEPGKSKPQKEEFPSRNFLFLFLPFLITLTVFIFWSFLEKLFLSPAKIKARALEQKAFRELKKAKSNLDARKSKEFHSHLRKSLESFLEMIINEPASSLTLSMIEEKLKTAQISEKTAKNIIDLLQEIDSAEFSSEKVQKTELKKRLIKATSILKGKEVKLKTFAFLLMVIFALPHFTKDSTDILFKKGYEEQLKGNYSEAIKYFKMVEDYGDTYPALYYNIANAYFESGRIPYAILYYKKALKLDPSFSDAKTNLSIAQSLIKSKIAPYEMSPFDKFITSVDIRIIFYAALLFIVAGNLIFTLLKIFGALNRRYLLTRFSIFLMVIGLILSLLCYKSVSLNREFREAVVLENCEVFEKPDPKTKSKSSLPEGSVVYLSDISAGWAKIKWGEGQGYVDFSKVGVP